MFPHPQPVRRKMALLAILVSGLVPLRAARADNAMGYRLLTVQQAVALPRRGGALGLDIARSREMREADMVFDTFRIQRLRTGSAADRAGLHGGDEIVALDGRIFPSVNAFAAYVASVAPGSRMTADVIPAGGGPAQARRIALVVGRSGL